MLGKSKPLNWNFYSEKILNLLSWTMSPVFPDPVTCSILFFCLFVCVCVCVWGGGGGGGGHIDSFTSEWNKVLMRSNRI